MKTRTSTIYLFIAFSIFLWTGCAKDGHQGPAGKDATVYSSEWFSPSAWSGSAGDWYFEATAPDLTQDIVEGGVILVYCWLDGDLYESTAVRPLPAYAVGANWDFLIHEYGSIEFTSDMTVRPGTTGNKFRFIAIPGTIKALKSSPLNGKSQKELLNMPYKDVCRLFNISE